MPSQRSLFQKRVIRIPSNCWLTRLPCARCSYRSCLAPMCHCHQKNVNRAFVKKFQCCLLKNVEWNLKKFSECQMNNDGLDVTWKSKRSNHIYRAKKCAPFPTVISLLGNQNLMHNYLASVKLKFHENFTTAAMYHVAIYHR